MTETGLQATLRRAAADLSESGSLCALVGGLAVSARTEPRFTRDLDLAVAVSTDGAAQELVKFLRSKGYTIGAIVEQEAVGRLATVRLIPPGRPSLVMDLLFASSGIEREIVAAAEPLELIDGLVIRVATIPYLIAMKILSRDDARRPQDRMDLISLFKEASVSDLAEAREALQTIQTRGFNRGKNLLEDLESVLPLAGI